MGDVQQLDVSKAQKKIWLVKVGTIWCPNQGFASFDNTWILARRFHNQLQRNGERFVSRQ
jgi:hypothetical protein